MVVIFVEAPDALRINDEHVDGFSVLGLALERSSPDPQTLSAGIDSRTNSESFLSVEKHAI